MESALKKAEKMKSVQNELVEQYKANLLELNLLITELAHEHEQVNINDLRTRIKKVEYENLRITKILREEQRKIKRLLNELEQEKNALRNRTLFN